MLPAKYKIKKTTFPLLMRRGKIFHSPHLTLRAFKQEEPCKERARFAFVVSKKVAKKAVERNTLKRKGYDAVHNIIKKTKPCFLCAFFLKKNDISSRGELEKEINNLLKSAGVLL